MNLSLFTFCDSFCNANYNCPVSKNETVINRSYALRSIEVANMTLGELENLKRKLLSFNVKKLDTEKLELIVLKLSTIKLNLPKDLFDIINDIEIRARVEIEKIKKWEVDVL